MSVASVPTYAGEATGRWAARNWPWLVAATVVALCAYGPLVGMFFAQQWEKPQYQYFPFVIAAFIWLFWQRYSEGEPRLAPRTRGIWLDRTLLIASFGLQGFSIAIHSPWGAMASLILLAAYGCRVASRTREMINLWGVWFLLLLLLPMPFGWDQLLVQKLQRVSSLISSFALDAVGVNHLMEGNKLTLPDKQLFVDEACSGIISILSVVACAVIYAVVKNRTPLHMILLAVVGIGWATVINVGRISSIAFVYDKWGIDWSSGAPHEILSLVLFLVTFLALLSSDLILLVCLEPVAASWHRVHAADLRLGASLAKAWDWIVSLGKPGSSGRDEHLAETLVDVRSSQPVARSSLWRPVLLFVPLAIAQTALFVFALSVLPEGMPTIKRAIELTSQDLPATIGDLKQAGFDATQRPANDTNGKYSRTYRYTSPDGAVYTISVDFPFSGGWHELTACYASSGWNGVKREVRSADAAAGAWKYVEADFEKPGDGNGTVLFTEFDQFGDPLDPTGGWDRPMDSFMVVRNLYLETRKTLQVQVFVVGPTPITEEQRTRAREILRDVRARVHQLAVRPVGAPAETGAPSS